MHPLLSNIFWHALTGPHARFAVGSAAARRFTPGFPPMAGFADRLAPDFRALEPWCQPGEQFYCDGWAGAAPTGWAIDFEGVMHKMLWDSAAQEPAPALPTEVRQLTGADMPQAVELTTLTKPGPFGPRTLELGDYLGWFEANRLVAMAGERLRAGTLREISGVCTHPDYQGRGLARQLVELLIQRQQQRGEASCLHVMRSNAGAVALYQRMGFHCVEDAVVRVVSRQS